MEAKEKKKRERNLEAEYTRMLDTERATEVKGKGRPEESRKERKSEIISRAQTWRSADKKRRLNLAWQNEDKIAVHSINREAHQSFCRLLFRQHGNILHFSIVSLQHLPKEEKKKTKRINWKSCWFKKSIVVFQFSSSVTFLMISGILFVNFKGETGSFVCLFVFVSFHSVVCFLVLFSDIEILSWRCEQKHMQSIFESSNRSERNFKPSKIPRRCFLVFSSYLAIKFPFSSLLFSITGATFLYIRHKDLYLVAVTNMNTNPSESLLFVLAWLQGCSPCFVQALFFSSYMVLWMCSMDTLLATLQRNQFAITLA